MGWPSWYHYFVRRFSDEILLNLRISELLTAAVGIILTRFLVACGSRSGSRRKLSAALMLPCAGGSDPGTGLVVSPRSGEDGIAWTRHIQYPICGSSDTSHVYCMLGMGDCMWVRKGVSALIDLKDLLGERDC